MELLVIRHAIAEDQEAFAATGKDDSLRPLTTVGRARMALVARGLRRRLPALDVLASSPYTRAVQTAKIVADAYRGLEIEEVAALTPDSRPQALMAWLKQRGDDDRVAVVGHEPHLGALVYWLLAGEFTEGRVEMRKGGACLLDFGGRPGAGKARLRWSAPPSILRRLAD
jgi:phosphohistidine phosphatase